MSNKTEVWQGTLALMVLKTLSAMGPQHGTVEMRLGAQTSVIPLAVMLDPQGRPMQAGTAGTYVLSQPSPYRVQLMTPARGQTASYTLAVGTAAAQPVAQAQTPPAVERRVV